MQNQITNCRGDETKESLVKNYDIRPISRLKIAKNHNVEGCCGELTDEQIVFFYSLKSAPKTTGVFSVGEDCAKKFLALISLPMPPLTDPFQSIAPSSSNGSPSGNGPVSSSNIIYAPINIELYDAINLWCSLKKQVPKFALAEILLEISSKPGTAIADKRIHDFLKVVASFKSTLADLLIQTTAQGTLVKPMRFPILDAIAAKNWINLP